jgi:nitrogen regulatory protein P-II 1
MSKPHFQLIVVIVSQGSSSPLVAAAKGAGAEGATILRGRGSGVHEAGRFLGIPIEPEKDIMLILIDTSLTDAVLEAIIKAGELDTPGKGIAFVLDVPRVEGIVHRGEVVSSKGKKR